ncbi:MAG: hypothetical protein AAGK32_02475 [Actinomycetota bacterium]
MASDLFAELWVGAIELAHGTASEVLAGDSELVEANEDGIVINFIPVINGVLAEITSASPEIFGRTVNLPDITVDDVPDEARDAIGDALGVEIDDDFGTFVIYDEGALSAAQEAVELADQLVWLFVIAAPLVIAGTIAVSTRRRRTLLQLTIGIAFTMVLLRRFLFLFQDDLLELVEPANAGAVDSVASTFLDPLLAGAQWIGVIALVIAAIAAVTGPYPWEVSLRTWVAGTARGAATAVVERSEDEDTQVWVAENREALQIGGVVAGFVLLWVLNVEWLGFFVLVAVVGVYELVVSRLAERGESVAGDDDAGPADPEVEAAAESATS